METTTNKNLATFTHLSVLSQYCIPFGNFIFPLLIWSSNKNKSEFVDYNGKQVLNFQLSFLLYSLLLAVIFIPIFIINVISIVAFQDIINERYFMQNHFSIENITGMVILGIIAFLLLVALKTIEFILIIYAAVKASNGEKYTYPLTIPFLK